MSTWRGRSGPPPREAHPSSGPDLPGTNRARGLVPVAGGRKIVLVAHQPVGQLPDQIEPLLLASRLQSSTARSSGVPSSEGPATCMYRRQRSNVSGGGRCGSSRSAASCSPPRGGCLPGRSARRSPGWPRGAASCPRGSRRRGESRPAAVRSSPGLRFGIAARSSRRTVAGRHALPKV